MTQKGIAYQEQVLVFAWKATLMNHKVAFALVTLIQVLLWINFKHVVTHLKTNWLHLWGHIFAGLFDVAKCLIGFTVKFRQSCLPLVLDLVEHIWRNRKLRTSSVDNCWVAHIFSWFLHSFCAICHSLTFKCPCSKPVGEVFECLKAFFATYNLRGIITTKQCIRGLSHFFGCYTKAYDCMVNNSIILERPKIVELLLAHVFMGRKSKNTIRVLTQTLRFVES